MSTTSKHDVAVWKIHVYWMHLLVSLQILQTQARAWLSAVTEHMAVTLYAEVHLQWLLTVAPVFLLLPPFSKAFSLHPHWHWTPTEGFTEQISEMTFDRIWGGGHRERQTERWGRGRERGALVLLERQWAHWSLWATWLGNRSKSSKALVQIPAL